MKKSLRNILLAGAIALPAYAGISSVYSNIRQYPEIVREEKLQGFDLKIVRTKSKNPALRTLDKMLIGQNNFSNYTDKKGNMTIDLSSIDERYSQIEKDWNLYEENAKYLKTNDSKWDFQKQIVYNYLKKYPISKLREDSYKSEMQKELTNHELRHAEDSKEKKYLLGKAETRAYLIQLQDSPLAFADLEWAKTQYEKGNLSAYYAAYQQAAQKIFDEFLSYPDTKSKKDIANLSEREVSKRAKEIYQKLYPAD